MNVQFDILHGVNSQIVVSKERVQAKQAHQAKVAQHFVQATLSKQIVLQLKEQVLLILAKLTLIDASIRIGYGKRQGGMLEYLELLVYIGLGDQSVQHIEHTVHIPHVLVLFEHVDFLDDVDGSVLALFDEFGAVLTKRLKLNKRDVSCLVGILIAKFVKRLLDI